MAIEYGATIQLYDKMSPVLNKILGAMNMTVDAAQHVGNSIGKGFDSYYIENARRAAADAAAAMNEMSSAGRNVGDAVERAGKAQKNLNEHARAGADAFDSLVKKAKSIAGAFAGMQGLKSLLNLSDEMTGYEAKISLVTDPGSVDQIKAQAFRAAQDSRGNYTDMLSSVSRMGLLAGKAFRDPMDETKTDMAQIVRFQELVNKNFVIGGASAQEQTSAMYQLTQAMGSGRLQGDEYRSIIENAPLLAQSIEDYMKNVKGAEGTMKDWASEGLLTADVIKNAVFSAADETEERFGRMPMTWAQVFASAKNEVVVQLEPVLKKINELANNPAFLAMVQRLRGGFSTISAVAGRVVDGLVAGASFISENWGVIAPILGGVAAAVIVLKTAQAASMGITAASVVFERLHAAQKARSAGMSLAQAAATKTASGAQVGYNAALLACPLTWIIIAVIAVIAAIIAVIKYLQKAGVISDTVLGAVVGGLNVAWTAIKNLGLTIANVALGIWEAMKGAGENIKTAFWNCIYSVKGFFDGLVSKVLNCVAKIADALNSLPFIEFDVAGIQNAADEYAAKAAAAGGKKGEYTDLAEAFRSKSGTFETWTEGWASSAYEAGAEKGNALSEKLSSMFSGEEGVSADADLLGGNIADTLNSIDTSTSNIDDTVTGKSTDELKYLRMIAERETINRYTTSQINLEMRSEATINSDTDIDGYFNAMTEAIREELLVTAEGLER